MNDAALRAKWFHAIDLGGGVITPNRFGPSTPPNYTLHGFFDLVRHVELAEARCFDVGTMDGLAAFVMKGLGAREVVACDMAPRATFEHARERLGLDVAYRTPVNALELPRIVGPERADVVLLAGVLYHVYDPLTVLVACRESLRREGFLFLETTFLFDEGEPKMSFNPADRSARRIPFPHVYWRASKAAVHGMLQLAGFEVVATRAVDGRLTVLAQAKRPSEIAGRDALVAAAQDRHRHRHYREAADFDALEAETGPASSARYRGPRDDRFLYRALFAPAVPYQPPWRSSSAVRWRDAARSARIHATMRLAEARAAAAPRVRDAASRLAPQRPSRGSK